LSAKEDLLLLCNIPITTAVTFHITHVHFNIDNLETFQKTHINTIVY